jgi:hypothetical protein
MFSDFTYAGIDPVARRGGPEDDRVLYSVAETDQALRLATALGLLSATELASLSGYRDVALACKARVVRFADHPAAH